MKLKNFKSIKRIRRNLFVESVESQQCVAFEHDSVNVFCYIDSLKDGSEVCRLLRRDLQRRREVRRALRVEYFNNILLPSEGHIVSDF